MSSALKKQDSSELAIPDYGEDAGLGFDQNDGYDVAWLKLLQSNSSAVVNEEPGAKPGIFYNTATGEAYGAEINVLIVREIHEALEWKPEMGGFVGSHSLDSDVWKNRIGSFPKFETKDGNKLTEGYTLTLLVCRSGQDPDPVLFTCDYKKAKEYKKIKRRMRMVKGDPPTFAFPLKFSIVSDKNPAGQPIKGLKIEQAGNLLLPTDVNYIAAKVFNEKLNGSPIARDVDDEELY